MRRAEGFTLIEVLAAVSILGLALFILLDSQWTSLNIHNTINEEVTLGELVQTIVGKAEIGVLSGQLSDGGDFGSLYPDYSWNYDASQHGDSDDPDNKLYEVQINVTGPQGDKALSFYVYDNNPDNDQDSGLFGQNGDSFGKNGFGTKKTGFAR